IYGRITYQQLMPPENPKIAYDRYRRLRQVRNSVFVGESFPSVLSVEQTRQFLILKSGEAEVKIRFLDLLKFQREQVVIPVGPGRRAVHHEPECLYLRRRPLV